MAETPKKRIGKLKIGLVLSAIVIVVLAGLNIWLYLNKTSLESQLKERWDSWGSELYWHNYLEAPKLSTLSLYEDDVRPLVGTPYLHVYGEVWNIRTDTAYNCKLHVVAYQGAVTATDTYVDLDTIYGENKKSVDSKVYYSGSALTSWSITPEWTATP